VHLYRAHAFDPRPHPRARLGRQCRRRSAARATVYDNFGGVGALAVGHVVEVHGQADTAGGRYRVERLTLRKASYDDVSSSAQAEVEGYVSKFNTAAGSLRVAGNAAQLGSNVVYEDDVAADLKNGIRVEAKGSIQNGVLVVAKLEFESAARSRSRPSPKRRPSARSTAPRASNWTIDAAARCVRRQR
jgi:hypothetical protein